MGITKSPVKPICYNGKEYVYINDELVSEKRNIGFKTVHEFEFEGKPWQVTFDVIEPNNLLKQSALSLKIKRLLDEKLSTHFLGKHYLTFFIYGVIFGCGYLPLLGYFLGRWYGSTL